MQHTRLPCPSLSPGVCSNYEYWRQWRTGKPGMLQSMGLQSWTAITKQNHSDLFFFFFKSTFYSSHLLEILSFWGVLKPSLLTPPWCAVVCQSSRLKQHKFIFSQSGDWKSDFMVPVGSVSIEGSLLGVQMVSCEVWCLSLFSSGHQPYRTLTSLLWSLLTFIASLWPYLQIQSH